jgi:hypothetical protein
MPIPPGALEGKERRGDVRHVTTATTAPRHGGTDALNGLPDDVPTVWSLRNLGKAYFAIQLQQFCSQAGPIFILFRRNHTLLSPTAVSSANFLALAAAFSSSSSVSSSSVQF